MPNVRSRLRMCARYSRWWWPRARMPPRGARMPRSAGSRSACGFLAGFALAQRQVHPLRRDFLFLGQCEQLVQDVLGAAGVGAEHPEVVAAPPDLHVEARLEQSQVLIEQATEAGESRIVRRLEVELAQRLGGRCCHRRPRKLCPARASVTTVRANWPMMSAGPAKLIQRLFSVLPASWRPSFFAGRSTNTRCTVPTMRSLMTRA